MSRRRVLLFGVMTATFAAGYGVMFTVLDDFRDEYGIAASWLGTIVGVGFFTSFLAQVFLAPIADRGRARQLALIGAGLNIAGLLLMAGGTTLPVLLAGRFVSGLGTGMALPALRRIVINADPDNIGNNLGVLLSADVTGFALGPAISAVMVPVFGLASPFLAIAAANAAITVPLMLRMEVPPDSTVGVAKRRFAFDLLHSKPMLSGLAMGAAVFMMVGTFDALWVLVLDDLRASDFVANLGVTVFALPLIVLGAAGGRLAQRVGPFRLGPLGIVLGATFMFLYGYMPTGAAMLGVGIVHAISDGLTIPSAGVAVGIVAPPDRQAGAQGLLGASETLTGALTATAAGWLYEIGGRSLAYGLCSAVMVLLAGLAFWLAGPTYRVRRGDTVPVDDTPDPRSAVTGHA